MVYFEFTVLALVLVAASFTIEAEAQADDLLDVEKDIRFDLYTLKNPTEHQVLLPNDTQSFINSNFNRKVPTRFFIHGFRSNGELKESLTKAFLVEGNRDVNLIAINWERASMTLNYPAAANRYVEQIGQYSAQLIDWMVSEELFKLSDISVIGFSLGAHAAGFIGKHVRSGKLPKIIGLDPAGPLFSLDKPDRRLNRDDALYVETIHTSKLGFFELQGDVSFYPNGGRQQPSCSWDFTGTCSHQSAYKYFAESVRSNVPLPGQLCESFEALKKEQCYDTDIQTFLGGEPGSVEQPGGIFYIAITAD